MAEPKYGAFESNPARFTDNEAWATTTSGERFTRERLCSTLL